MVENPNIDEVAGAVRVSIGLLVRRLRQAHGDGELSLPETSALARLDRGGPATSSDLAKLEQISPQSMGATLATLGDRGLVERTADPDDGRRVVMTITPAGLRRLGDRRHATVSRIADALAAEFSPEELRRLKEAAPLLDRLAHII